MKLGSRRGLFAMAAVAAIAVVVASGYGYAAITATNNTYTGCLVSGSITNVAIGSAPTKSCQKPSQQISWSQTGPQGLAGQNGTNGMDGEDGVSVTSATEPAGANCADGGSKFTAANDNVTYACNGAKGDKGDEGDPGPASLAALQGSACTFDGHASTLQVSVDDSTGEVSLTCKPVYAVSVTVTGGVLDSVSIRDQTLFENYVFLQVSSVSVLLPKGTNVPSIQLSSGKTSGVQRPGLPFDYTCDGVTHSATPFPVDGGLAYVGDRCEVDPLNADFAVTATFPG